MCYQLLSLYTSDCRCMNMNMEHRWNDTDSGKPKYIKKNCSVHPKRVMKCMYSKWCDEVEDFFVCVNLSIPKIQKYMTTVQ